MLLVVSKYNVCCSKAHVAIIQIYSRASQIWPPPCFSMTEPFEDAPFIPNNVSIACFLFK